MDYFNSQCGYVSQGGRECGYWAIEDSPVNLCFDHLREAYEYAVANMPTVSRRAYDNMLRCPDCEKREVYKLQYETQTAICEGCGFTGPVRNFTQVEFEIRRRAKLPPVVEPEGSVVYYIKHGERIKIGTSVSWHKRLLALPHDALLALEPGGYGLEQKRHSQFSSSRVRRTEWFTVNDDLIDHIDSVREKYMKFDDAIRRHNRSRLAA